MKVPWNITIPYPSSPLINSFVTVIPCGVYEPQLPTALQDKVGVVLALKVTGTPD